jgi:NAD(P) transhydrogenase subunit alpha
MPSDASRMFGNNIINLLKIMVDKEGRIVPDMGDEVISGTTAVHGGEYVSPRVKQMLEIKQTV